VRRGWTVPEMLIALTVTSLIVALAAGAAVSQLRIYRGIGEIAAVRTQVSQAALVTANVLRDLPSRRHILVAMDSALEAATGTGTSFTCEADTGRIVVARPAPSGNTMAAFAETPQIGDDVEILAVDSSVGRLDARIASDAVSSPCARFPDAGAWSFTLAEPFVVAAGMPVRFTRRVRLSAYRASDGLWYLGLKEWNTSLARFNSIQPVAGPLLPQGASPPGFSLEYRDASGALLSPADPSRVATVTVITRGDSPGPVRIPGMRLQPGTGLLRDSSIISVAVR
jgi:hypothetical protein